MSLDLDTLPVGTTWVFTGDSITHGGRFTGGERSWVEHVHERIRWQLDRLQDVVINTGVSGLTVPWARQWWDALVTRFDPDVVSIALGTNDVDQGEGGLAPFAAGLGELVRRSADLGAQVVLHTPVLAMSDTTRLRRELLPAYGQLVREVAASEGALLVDHERVWRERFGEQQPTAWMSDHTHPGAEGHRQMAATTLRALGLGELEVVQA